MSIVGGLLRFLIGGIAVFADQILRVPEIAFFIWSHSRQINVKTRLGFKEMSKGGNRFQRMVQRTESILAEGRIPDATQDHEAARPSSPLPKANQDAAPERPC